MPIDQPNLEPVLLKGGRQGFRVESDWRYIWATPSRRYGLIERELRVPGGPAGTGFLHDGASIPRLFWTPLGLAPAGLVSAAALVHDALYRCHGILPDGWIFERPAGTDGWIEVLPEKRQYTRKAADRMLRQIMIEAGIRWLQAELAYLAVRCFGWRAWSRQRELVEEPEE